MAAVIAKERMFTFEAGQTTARNVVILKRATTVTIAFDFNHKLDSGLTISTAPITQVDSNGALTIGASDIRNEEVSAAISGWVTEKRYRLRCTANMSDSSIIIVEGWVEVITV